MNCTCTYQGIPQSILMGFLKVIHIIHCPKYNILIPSFWVISSLHSPIHKALQKYLITLTSDNLLTLKGLNIFLTHSSNILCWYLINRPYFNWSLFSLLKQQLDPFNLRFNEELHNYIVRKVQFISNMLSFNSTLSLDYSCSVIKKQTFAWFSLENIIRFISA